MTLIDIDINSYLSEEEKKELIITVFKEQVKKELFKSEEGTVQSDSEVQRIIGNISYQIVMDEMRNHIPNFEKMIKDKVKETIESKDLSYYIFKKKDLWDKEESLAVTFINQVLNENKPILKDRIMAYMMNYDISKDVSDEVSGLFSEMANTLESLSKLFQNK